MADEDASERMPEVVHPYPLRVNGASRLALLHLVASGSRRSSGSVPARVDGREPRTADSGLSRYRRSRYQPEGVVVGVRFKESGDYAFAASPDRPRCQEWARGVWVKIPSGAAVLAWPGWSRPTVLSATSTMASRSVAPRSSARGCGRVPTRRRALTGTGLAPAEDRALSFREFDRGSGAWAEGHRPAQQQGS